MENEILPSDDWAFACIAALPGPRYAYVQYVGKHPDNGEVIRVLPGLHERQVSDQAALINQPGYVAFYPARYSVKHGGARIVGSYPLKVEVPRIVRREGAITRTGEVLTWVIEDEGHETVRKQLSEAEK